jgi:transcriptional regulator with XRE-family HTH domain
MKPFPDTFVFTAELGDRLRDLRLRAGLTQLELARAMGRAGKNAGNLVSRLERGDERYPSFGLVADFLRGCRARFRDLSDILDLYTDLPTTQQQVYAVVLEKAASAVLPKWRAQVRSYDRQFDLPRTEVPAKVERAMPDRLKRLERARRNIAAARRRFFYGQFLSRAVNETGLEPVMSVTVPMFNHGLELFRILSRTRKARPGKREKLLAEARTSFEQASRFPPEAIQKLEDGVRRQYAQMEMSGDIDWLPALGLDEYEASLLKPARKRTLRQEQHDDYVRKFNEYDAARKAAVEQVWAELQPMLDSAGVPTERRTVYRRLVGVCFTAATGFEPGSAGERAQVDEYILNPQWIGLGLDTALAQKLAGVMLVRFRELAKSFPPDPRPKR